MKKSEKYYDEFGGSRLVPENPMETEVVRQAILADKWDLVPEQAETLSESDNYVRFALGSRGGQAVYLPEWSKSWIAHYEVGQHERDGFFDLQVRFYPVGAQARTDAHDLPGFSMLAALRAYHKPVVQGKWDAVPREWFWHPWWYVSPPLLKASRLELHPTGLTTGPLVVNSPAKPSYECHAIAPHVLFVQPNTLRAPGEN